MGSTLHNSLLFITYSFLQIPPRDGHPCCSAIHFPLLGCVRDFHPLERAHGAQTKIRQPNTLAVLFLFPFFYYLNQLICSGCKRIFFFYFWPHCKNFFFLFFRMFFQPSKFTNEVFLIMIEHKTVTK